MRAAVRRRARDEAGLTLIEVLVTVAILGIAFVTVVGGMAVSIAGSDMHRKQATSQTVLRNLAEFMKAAPYVGTCPPDYSPALAEFSSQVNDPRTEPYSVSPRTEGVAYTVNIAEPVEVWNAKAEPPAFEAAGERCTDTGLQRLRLEVQSVARPDLAPESLFLVKRAP